MDQVDGFDPYGVNGKVQSRNIGTYRLAAEVSWMSVGKAELEYASEALKGYRYDVLLTSNLKRNLCHVIIYIHTSYLY